MRLVESVASEELTLALLRMVLDQMPEGVALLVPVDGGRDFEYVYANRAHSELRLGGSPVGKTYGEVWPEFSDLVLPHLREVYGTGLPWGVEDAPLQAEIEKGNAQTRYYTFELSRIYVDDTMLLLDRSHETTAEVRRLQELRASEERFRSVLENSLDAAYRRDLRTDTYDYMSPVIETITGFSAEEFANLTLEEVLDRVHPDDLRAIQDALPKALESGRLTLEYRLRRKDDRYVWLADHAVVVNDADGEPAFRSGVVRDITGRKQLEEQAEREHRRLQALLDTLPVAVFISNAEGGIVYTNKQVDEIWGELPQTPTVDEYGLYKAWKPETGERLRGEDWSGARALRGETTFGEVLEIERFDGRRGSILNSSIPIRDEQGSVIGQVTVEQDITEQARIEEQLRQSLDAQREAVRYGDALNEVDADVASTLHVDEIMRVVVERASQTVGADIGVIYVPRDGEWEARYTWQAPDWLQGLAVRSESIPYSVHATRERRAMLFQHAAEHEGWEESVAAKVGARQVLDAPLMLGAEEAGNMTLYKLGEGDFTEADRDFLRKAAAVVSLALQNARRYERERDISNTLQEALLALPDEIPGIEFAHAYHSAAEAARVGGDFYDLFPISSTLLAITVGDVAGKGLGASALTSLVKNAIRAHAAEKGACPGTILELTNDLVYESTLADSFVTVFFGVLDCRDGRLVYANAGHTTGAIVPVSGTAAALPATGPVLGAFSGMRFEESECLLDADESIFLYTDGLTEARRDGELFGEERVFELLGRLREGSPADTVRAVVGEALKFAGGRLNDDLAILDVKRTKQGEPAPRSQKVEV